MQNSTSTDAREIILDRLARLNALPPGRVDVGCLGPPPVPGATSNGATRYNVVIAGYKVVTLPLAAGASVQELGTGDGHFSVSNTWELQDWNTRHELLCIVPRAEYLRVSLYLNAPPAPQATVYYHTNRPHAPEFLHVLRALETLARQRGRVLPSGLLQTFSQLAEEAVARPPAQASDHNLQRCAEIRRFIENTFQESLTREDVARHFGLSTGHLSLLFKEAQGRGVGEYIRDCRMQLAESLLRDTHLTVGQVAAQCGFGSAVHFVRAFRQRHGTPPGRWRSSLS